MLILAMCQFIQDSTDARNKDNLVSVRNGTVEELAHICGNCGVTAANVRDDEFSCRRGLTKQIVYRARIVGTDVYSAPGLVSLMKSWVDTGRASIRFQSSRLHLDPACNPSLDSLKSPDCELGERRQTELPPKPTDSAHTQAVSKGAAQGGASPGEIGGIVVGGVIAALLVVLIVLLIVVIAWKLKSKVSIRFVSRVYFCLHALGFLARMQDIASYCLV